MTADRETLLNLSSAVSELRQRVGDLHDAMGQLCRGTTALGAGIATASQRTSMLGSEIGVLSARIQDELRLGRAQRKIVFVVDHDADARTLASEALLGAGFAAQGFSRAEELLEVLPIVVPKAVLIDLEVPGMPGSVLAEYLRSNPRTARIHRLGMTSFVPSRQEARPFTSFIDKPLDADSLVAFVRRSLHRDRMHVSSARL
jgi:CheY-like chemotaxis protein